MKILGFDYKFSLSPFKIRIRVIEEDQETFFLNKLVINSKGLFYTSDIIGGE